MHALVDTNRGKIAFRLQAKDAPRTVENFVKLARQGFYDNLAWHRVVPNFVIQTGCPKGDGTGGPGYKVEAEINEREHVKGTVAMARGKNLNSGGSQFYIARSRLPHLDRKYTVFGQVTSGIEVLDKIVEGDKVNRVSIIED
jgi:peptidyl-prolyl cis-trans isomerase B (cyclophilin B)